MLVHIQTCYVVNTLSLAQTQSDSVWRYNIVQMYSDINSSLARILFTDAQFLPIRHEYLINQGLLIVSSKQRSYLIIHTIYKVLCNFKQTII